MSPDRFEAMGVDVLVGGATEAELEAIGLLFEKLDRTFSRFRPDSELNRVNAAPAEFVAASPMFVRVLALALDAASRTDGLVDPTLGAAIEAAGYDRDFAEVTDDERPPAAGVPGSWRHVRRRRPARLPLSGHEARSQLRRQGPRRRRRLAAVRRRRLRRGGR
jgi:thiamine biosynthesis lipoprotein ApbE